MEIKETWADFVSDGFKAPDVLWKRFDDKAGNRSYFANNKGEPILAYGITTALDIAYGENEFIREWKDKKPDWKKSLQTMADYGSLCHLGLYELLVNKEISEESIDKAGKIFGKKIQFAKDMMSIRQFIIDYNVKPLLIEATIGQEFLVGSSIVYLVSTIDLLCEMDYKQVFYKEEPNGFYVKGDKKGQPKMEKVKVEEVSREMCLVDLKSNFEEKESKTFYDSHKRQLFFGQDCVEKTFGSCPKIFNLSPLGWRSEPKYLLKEHTSLVNDFGFGEKDLMYNRLKCAAIEGNLSPNGTIKIIESTTMANFNIKTYSYLEYVKNILQ
ncbi:MAG: hypothetical protein ACRCXZ_03015 [Patescibacteria group bacterium]